MGYAYDYATAIMHRGRVLMEPINFGTMGDIRVYVSSEDQARAMALLNERNVAYDKLDDNSETVVTDDGPAVIDDLAESEVETER